MRTFTDAEGETVLYVATLSSGGYPARILKFSQNFVPGTDPVVVGEFSGSSSLRRLVVHDGMLYAASFAHSGCKIWGSDDPARGNWMLVAETSDFPLGDGVPGAYPRNIPALVSFNENLYAFIGVINLPPGIDSDFPLGAQGGFWVYKSDNPAVGGWEETMRLGAGNHWNEEVSHAAVFGDHVYVGTAIGLITHMYRLLGLEGYMQIFYALYLTLSWKGCDVLRFDGDDNWELVIGDPEENTVFDDRVGDRGAGFDNPSNTYAWRMEVFDNTLFVGTFDGAGISEGARNLFGTLLDETLGERESLRDQAYCGIASENASGGDLWATEDGARWIPYSLDGFQDSHNYGIRSLIATDRDLFVGTANPFYGTEIWKKRHRGEP